MRFSKDPNEKTAANKRAVAVIAGITLLALVSITVIAPLALDATRSLARAQFVAAAHDADRATPPRERPSVVYVGNSFIGGSAQDSGPEFRWPALVSDAAKVTPLVLADGGSGYTVPGALGFTFGDLAAQVPETCALVVVLGSDNDELSPYDETKKAASTTLETVKKRAPHAHVIAIATFWVNDNPSEGILTSRDAVRDAAADVGVQFIDPLSDHWLEPDPKQYIGDDDLHPTNLGHRELANIITPIVEGALNQPAP